MGTGWRRALCTSVQRDDDDDAKAKKRRPHDASPRSGGGFFFSSSSSSSKGPATPTLRCRTKPLQEPPEPAPVTPPPSAPAPMRKPPTRRMPLLQALSAPASPRSPSRFALLKKSLLPNKCRCGVCSRSVKSSGSSAVFTAECSHSFHFPCIAAHARSTSGAGALSCPVCASPWRQAPFLASLRLHCSLHDQDNKHHRPVSSSGGGTKLYDDDEPLVASNNNKAAGGNFNPIPEDDDEEAAAAANEFKGFFPTVPSSGGGSTALLAVSVAPEVALLSSGRRHGKYVVAVKVKAPSSGHVKRRAPIDLVTVLDVSHGMMGEKLQTLKRGMRLVVASLGPADRLSIVAFSGASKRLLPLRRMTRQGQRAARQIVDRLVVCAASASSQQGQQTQTTACVGDALRKATKVLEDRRDRNPVATVMLLSDTTQQQQQQQGEGEARSNNKPHHHRHQNQTATRFTHVEIPAMDQKVQEHEQQGEEEAFAKCLGGLVSVVMQEVHLELLFPTGEITAVYSSAPGGQPQVMTTVSNSNKGAGTTSVRLGEMYAEEERELLLELRAPLNSTNNGHVLSVRCGYRDPATQDTVRGDHQTLLLPPLSPARTGGRLHDLFVATRAVAESRRLAELHDLATAIHLLSSARALLMHSSSHHRQHHQEDLVASLDTELSDMRWRRTQQQQQPLTPTSARSGGARTPRGGHHQEPTTPPSGTPRAPGEPLTPTSAWRAAEQLAKVAIMRKSMNRVSDLHGFENARF